MKWKKPVLMFVWGVALVGWLGIAAVAGAKFLSAGFEIDTRLWIAYLTGVAIVTEAAFWATAAILGVTILESRKRIFGAIFSPFRKRPRGDESGA